MIDEKGKTEPLQGQQLAVLLGSMLGDGCLHSNKTTANFIEVHAINQKEYLLWKATLWGSRITKEPKEYPPRKVTHQSSIAINTISTEDLYYWWKLFYQNSPIDKIGKRQYRHKLFPRDIVSCITPLALAIWYMDDGGIAHWPFISCHERNQQVGLEILKQFGIDARPVISQSSKLIIETKEQAISFINIIKPHIHPTLLYKTEMPHLGISEYNNNIDGQTMITAINKGATLLDLCNIFKTDKTKIRSKLLEMGLVANNSRPLPEADYADKVIKTHTGKRAKLVVPKEVLEELIKRGLNFRQIQGKLGISHKVLRRQYSEYNLSLETTRGNLGGGNNKYKHITKDKILEELNKGKTIKTIASDFGCHHSTIATRIKQFGLQRIKNNNTWIVTNNKPMS